MDQRKQYMYTNKQKQHCGKRKKECAFCTFLCLNHFAFSRLASQKDVKKRINGPPLKGKTKGLIFAPFHVLVILRFSIEGRDHKVIKQKS